RNGGGIHVRLRVHVVGRSVRGEGLVAVPGGGQARGRGLERSELVVRIVEHAYALDLGLQRRELRQAATDVRRRARSQALTGLLDHRAHARGGLGLPEVFPGQGAAQELPCVMIIGALNRGERPIPDLLRADDLHDHHGRDGEQREDREEPPDRPQAAAHARRGVVEADGFAYVRGEWAPEDLRRYLCTVAVFHGTPPAALTDAGPLTLGLERTTRKAQICARDAHAAERAR